MKIFLSHSSRQKPLVREVKKYFPEHIYTWIDEENIFIGDHIDKTLQEAVNEKSDYVLLFLDRDAARSSWVQKEIAWAFEAEQEHNRIILLVILIDDEALPESGFKKISERRYLKCTDFSERGIELLANTIVADLFALVCRDLEKIEKPDAQTQLELLESADEFIHTMSQNLMALLFPYRRDNAITVDGLLEQFNRTSNQPLSKNRFRKIINTMSEKDLMPGVSYDGHELFIMEEHYKWKTRLNLREKVNVARIAAKQVRSGDTLAIDAGSATDELVRVICERFKSRSLANVTIVTNSLSATRLLLDMSDIHGFDEHSCPFKTYLIGGFVRPNTRAVVKAGDVSEGG